MVSYDQSYHEYFQDDLFHCLTWCLPLAPIEIIRAKGLERINLEDLVEELLPKGRSLVPTQVKEDLLGQIKVFLEND